MNDEELTEWAIGFIGVVDYDIEKECRNNLEEFGEDELVDEMKSYILKFVEKV